MKLLRPIIGRPLLEISLLLALFTPSTAIAQDARIDFMLECRGCHLSDGTGSPGSVPNLRDSMAKFLTVPGGREFLVRVPGSAQSPLSDDALASVLNWMLQEFGPKEIASSAKPYTGAEVAVLRASPLVDVEATRSALIDRLEDRLESTP